MRDTEDNLQWGLANENVSIPLLNRDYNCSTVLYLLHTYHTYQE